MNDFEAYKLYISIKNHFTKKTYDHIKYRGNSRLNIKSFEKRNDKIFFLKLSKHKDLENYLVSNFSINNKLWIKDLAYSEQSEQTYKDWLKRQQSLSYIFKEDLSKLILPFDDNFIIKDNEHPILLKLYLRKEITLETLCILVNILDIIKYWDKKLEYDPLWEDIRLKIEKYSPFIKYDKDKMKKICIDFFSDLE